MFVLAELKDTIRIAPEMFHLKLIDAVKDEINRKLANKVLLNVGLCIALDTITKLGDSIILPGDGASHTEVHFRYIVFRPSIGDVITGKIRSCSREGVHITLGFFDDIIIPPTSLQHPSRFEETEQAWVWEYPTEEGGHHDLYMDIGEPIKFRVFGETFEESSPVGPQQGSGGGVGGSNVGGNIGGNSSGGSLDNKLGNSAGGVGGVGSSAGPSDAAKTPYRIIVAINESGLGLLSWWDQQTQQTGEEDDAGEEYEE